MELLFDVEGGESDELQRLEQAVREQPQITGRVTRKPGAIAPGALGAEVVLEFIGENVLLPLLLQTVYDHLTRRRRSRAAARMRVQIVRTDLPTGERRTEVSFDATTQEAVEALIKELS